MQIYVPLHSQLISLYLEVPVHEPLAVQEFNSFCNLQKDVQTLVVLPLLWQAALSHPVLQVLLTTQLHLDVKVHLETQWGVSIHHSQCFTQEMHDLFGLL